MLDCFYTVRDTARAQELQESDTCARPGEIYMSKSAPGYAMLRIFTKGPTNKNMSGKDHFILTTAALNRQECLDLSDALRELAAGLQSGPQWK